MSRFRAGRPGSAHPVGGVLDPADPRADGGDPADRRGCGDTGGGAGARLGTAGAGGRAEGSVEQTVEALSRDVAGLHRQLTERQAS